MDFPATFFLGGGPPPLKLLESLLTVGLSSHSGGGISDPQSSGLSSLKGSAKPGGGGAVVPLQLATEVSYCKPEG